MGHLFTRMATIWLEEQRAQNNLTAFQSNSNKRKRSDLNELSNKRKASSNSTSKTESDDEDERLTLSPRICPIITKSSTANHRSIQSVHSNANYAVDACLVCDFCLFIDFLLNNIDINNTITLKY
ncbi:unnamed protein product [Adineta ricciae]|uniref:Uncharacterized protein n=1 Tax=Adineta ricciae TaxID=249248 RepID=A0A813MLW3_ADIRI|nr:unnamed protein product [Adineta ricciae]